MEPIYQPVKMEVRLMNPTHLSKLVAFCTEQRIPYTAIAPESFVPVEFDTTPKIPTKAFRDYCGPTWLNPKGETSQRGVYNYLQHYIKLHNLRQQDGRIMLPPGLQTALGVKVQYVSDSQLIPLSKNVFEVY